MTGPLARLPLAWRRALVAALALRGVVAIVSILAVRVVDPLAPVDVDPVPGTGFAGRAGPPADLPGAAPAVGGIERWDALWYLAIAEHGYPAVAATEPVPEAWAFFPLFPALVGAVGRLLVGEWVLAANLVAIAATVAALAAVHRLVEFETGDPALAGRALVAVAVFPSAYFLVAPYTEALFLACSGWALVALRRGRWYLAGGLAALAATSRSVGVLLVVAFAVEAWRQRRRLGPARAIVGLASAPAGLGLFLAWAWMRTGRPLAPLVAQEGWQREWSLPHETLRLAFETATAPGGTYHAVDLALFLPVLAAVAWLIVRAPRVYGLYALAHLGVWLVHPWPGRPLMSTYRFALAIAPVGWAFAAWTRRRGLRIAWGVVSGAGLVAMIGAFATWRFVF